MNLNLPQIPAFRTGSNILLVGVGGGFDFLGTLPLAYDLEHVHRCFTVTGDFAEEVGRKGVKPHVKWLQERVNQQKIDCIVAVDGGVDALMRGDEEDGGTLLEDSVVLASIAQIDVPHKVLACMGFGTEIEEGLCHYRALENIAALAAEGGFHGTCSLTPEMDSFKYYKKESEKAWQNRGRVSHIHSRVIPAVLGQFNKQTMYEGIDARVHSSTGLKAWVNPLMGIYWFFDLMKVYDRHLFAKRLIPTTTSTDALMIYRQQLADLMKNKRLSERLPL